MNAVSNLMAAFFLHKYGQNARDQDCEKPLNCLASTVG